MHFANYHFRQCHRLTTNRYNIETSKLVLSYFCSQCALVQEMRIQGWEGGVSGGKQELECLTINK